MLLTDKGAIGLQHLETGVFYCICQWSCLQQRNVLLVCWLWAGPSQFYTVETSQKVLSFVISRFHTRWTAYMIT